MPTVRVVTGDTPRGDGDAASPTSPPAPPPDGAREGGDPGGGGPFGGGGGVLGDMHADGGSFMGIRELRHQKSIRRRLQRWRSSRWFSRKDVNLDDSDSIGIDNIDSLNSTLSIDEPFPRVVRRGFCFLFFLVSLAGFVFGIIMGVDGIRLLPCMKRGSDCVEVGGINILDICNFDTLPFVLTTTSVLPNIVSTLKITSAHVTMGIQGADGILGKTTLREENALTTSTMTSGKTVMKFAATMDVTNTTGLAYFFSAMLNEAEMQLVIKGTINVKLQTPLRFSIPVAIHPEFYLTCGHVPCNQTICKYMCQFGDYPLKDLDPGNPYPYTTSIDSIRMWYDNVGQYVMSPSVDVTLKNFKASVAFPKTPVDGYFYEAPLPFGVRPSVDHKVLNGTIHPFSLSSFENQLKPFHMDLDLRCYTESPGQRTSLSRLTQRFLDQQPIYIYLHLRHDEEFIGGCPSMTKAFSSPVVPALRLNLNSHTTSRDGSDTTLRRLGHFRDIFRLNDVHVFNVSNEMLATLVNVSFNLPFQMYGSLPSVHFDGFSSNDDHTNMGHFRTHPLSIPFQENYRAANSTTAVIFTEAQLTEDGLSMLQSIFPNVLTALERLNIQLVGSPPQSTADVFQNFITNVTLKLSSLESSLVQKGPDQDKDKGEQRESRLFVKPSKFNRPKIHFEIYPLYDAKGQEIGLHWFFDLSYKDAFNGLFSLTIGNMTFTLLDGEDHPMGTVSVDNFRVSRPLTHFTASMNMTREQAMVFRSVLETYLDNDVVRLKATDGHVMTHLSDGSPSDVNMLANCEPERALYCPGSKTIDEIWECLSDAMLDGTHEFGTQCLGDLSAQGKIDITIDDLKKFMNIARGLATDVLDQLLDANNTHFLLKMVEILSFRTPGDPVDLQALLDSSWGTDKQTELDMQIRTNISVDLFEVLDVTFDVPPIAVMISAPLVVPLINNTHLFTIKVPSVSVKKPARLMMTEANVWVPDVYNAAYWLEAVIEEIEGKMIYAEPVYDGSIWSMVIEPFLLKVSVQDAIDPNRKPSPLDGRHQTLATASKVVFQLMPMQEYLLGTTDLIFSRPWTEGIDLSVPVTDMAIHALNVKQFEGKTNSILARCEQRPEDCPIGRYYAQSLKTQYGHLVRGRSILNITAHDDGFFWGSLLTEYVAGNTIGIYCKSTSKKGLQVDAKLILPKMPTLDLPVQQMVQKLERLRKSFETRRSLSLRENRQLSVADIWASIDPIIWSVTQPISAELEGLQLVDLNFNEVDMSALDTIQFDLGVVSRVAIVVRSSFDVDIAMTRISLDVGVGNLTSEVNPFASVTLEPFRFQTMYHNTSINRVNAKIRNMTTIMNLAKSAVEGNENMTLVLVGQKNDDSHLLSRIVSHMKVAISVSADQNDTEAAANDGAAAATEEEEVPTENKVMVKAALQSSADILMLGADVLIPAVINPLVFGLSMGEMALNFKTSYVTLARAFVQGFDFMTDEDLLVSVRALADTTRLGPALSVIRRIKNRKGFNVTVEGAIKDDVFPGTVSGTFKFSEEYLREYIPSDHLVDGSLMFDIDEFVDGNGLVTVKGLELVGGDQVGSTIQLPCLLKGWCEWPQASRAFSMKLRSQLALNLTKIIPRGIVLDITTPAIPADVLVREVPISPLGRVVIEPMNLLLEQTGSHWIDLTLTTFDTTAINQVANLLWESPLSVMVVAGSNDGDLLTTVLSQLPVVVEVPGPDPGTTINSLLTLPTFCDGRWSIYSTNASSFTAQVHLPNLTLPLALHLEDFQITLLYENLPSLRITTLDGSFSVGPSGATPTVLVTTIADERFTGGDHAAAGTAPQCKYPTRYPEYCLLGDAMGKLLSLGDRGKIQIEAVVTFRNKVAGGVQSLRMPLSLFGSEDMRPTKDPKTYKAMTCQAVNEMIQDIELKIGETIVKNLKFWDGLKISMRILTRNIYAFDVSLNRLVLNMSFRDPDGVPGRDPNTKDYPPSRSFALLEGTEVNMGNFGVAAGQTAWSPVIQPPLNTDTIVEALARLSDEVLNHKRLCTDMINSVFGMSLRKDNMSEAFNMDVLMSVREIALYSNEACNLPIESIAQPHAETTKEVETAETTTEVEIPPVP